MRIIASTIKALVVISIISCSSTGKKEQGNEKSSQLAVYAASGTRPAIERISGLYRKKDSVETAPNYASSGTLARQIANGAECDVFISANKQWVDFLLEKGLLEASTVQVIAKSSLVVITSLDSEVSVPDFTPDYNLHIQEDLKIAIGNPEFVPVGKYAKMVFDSLGWYKKLEPNFVMCKNVSTVRHYIELGECDWGIVYYTEAVQSEKLKIVSQIPSEYHKPINFYVAAHAKGNIDLAKSYIQFITSEAGKKVLSNFGFITL